MLEEIFASLPAAYRPEAVDKPLTFYFSLGEIKKTVYFREEECLVEDGKTLENADCVCKTTPEFFLKIWEDDYRPGMADFLSQKIKSNDPGALKIFLAGFGKKP